MTDGNEARGCGAVQSLNHTENEASSLGKSKTDPVQNRVLAFPSEVDEHIPAKDDIHPFQRTVVDQIVRHETD